MSIKRKENMAARGIANGLIIVALCYFFFMTYALVYVGITTLSPEHHFLTKAVVAGFMVVFLVFICNLFQRRIMRPWRKTH